VAGGRASREASRGEGPELPAGGLLIIWRRELPGHPEEAVEPTPGRRVSFWDSARRLRTRKSGQLLNEGSRALSATVPPRPPPGPGPCHVLLPAER
jgi:hypothetical protein